MGLVVCLLCFCAAFLASRKSRDAGLGTVLAVGYAYGILRANFPDRTTYFAFDAAVMGFLTAMLSGAWPEKRETLLQKQARHWFLLIVGWSVFMFLVPLQSMLIQLVGLRGNCMFLVFFFVGSKLKGTEADRLAVWMAVLNLIAFGFAIGEFFLGVPTFFPENEVTRIIYMSRDVGGYFRIPSTFAHAHSYGGMMVITVPWLLGSWMQNKSGTIRSTLLMSALAAALVGVFLSATRSNFIAIAVIILLATISGRMNRNAWALLVVLMVGVAYLVSGEERMQRFMSLADAEAVQTRLEGSVNMNFFQLLVNYPMGNGLGAGGTSIPSFLSYLINEPVGLENEYSRILLELGLPGLLIWIGFVVWLARHRPVDSRDRWILGRFVIWGFSLFLFATAVLGIGLMTAIPFSVLFMLGMGFVLSTPASRNDPSGSRPRSRQAATNRSTTRLSPPIKTPTPMPGSTLTPGPMSVPAQNL